MSGVGKHIIGCLFLFLGKDSNLAAEKPDLRQVFRAAGDGTAMKADAVHEFETADGVRVGTERGVAVSRLRNEFQNGGAFFTAHGDVIVCFLGLVPIDRFVAEPVLYQDRRVFRAEVSEKRKLFGIVYVISDDARKACL